jgi:predicted ATPase
MKIHSFQYADKEINWQIEPISFNNLTLLVGASGVGKTRILKSLNNIKRIAQGKSFNGVSWNIVFSVGQDSYKWSGEFELIKNGVFVTIAENEGTEKEYSETKRPNIIKERVIYNDQIFIQREGTSLEFKGEKSPIPIKGEQSVLSLIPDPIIQKAEQEFKKIIYSDYTNSAEGFSKATIIDSQVLIKYKSLDDIRNSDENLMVKFYWVYKKSKTTFKQIKDNFKAIFPQIEDLKIEPLEELKDAPVPFFFKAAPFIQFRETEMASWAPVIGMSAGMYRTLMHLVELYLSAEGTVILIDEFENSLGVNCIDELTTEIKGAIDRIQFIITSHHPYIINNISYKNWKIVTRNGSIVSAEDAKDLNFAKSKHEAFIQLLNLKAYKTGKK